MISEKEKVMLRRLVMSDEWQLAERIATEMIEDIKQRPKLKSTEWETLISAIGDEFEAKGIRALIQFVHKMAKESK